MNDDLMSKLPLRQHLKNMQTIITHTIQIDRKYFSVVWIVHLMNVIVPYMQLILSSYVLDSLSKGLAFFVIFPVVASILLAIAIIHAIQSWLWSVLEVRKERIITLYRCSVEERMLHMDFSRIDSPTVNDLKDRIQRDNNWGSGIYSIFWNINLFIFSSFHLIGAIVIGFPLFKYFQAKGASSALIVLGIVILIFLLCQRCRIIFDKMERHFMYYIWNEEEKKEAFSFCWDFSADQFRHDSDKYVRIYNAYDLMKRWILDPIKSPFSRRQLRMAAIGSGGSAFFHGFIQAILLGGSYLTVAILALTGHMSVGSVVVYAGCLTNLLTYSTQIISIIQELAHDCRQQMSTLEFLDLQDEMYKGSLPMEKRSDKQYQVEFRDVSFHYPGSQIDVLRHVSLKFTIGEKLAIVGMNGSGKTTLIKLLCRLYDPTEGEILLNGVNIRKFRQEEYNQLFSVVFQDSTLFSFLLAQNIALDTEYDADRVRACLEAAGFGERLASLPHGIETYINKDFEDNGVLFSGGESQKIALARAIYKDAPFVLLDEPTAALDPKAEYEIYTGFDRIIGDKTAVYISHRLSSCRFCEKIAVFHEGELIQLGSHEELLADEKGKYRELWQAQAQYYTQDAPAH